METFLDGRVTMHVGDVRAMLKKLPADHFDCIVTSPPYWGLRDYGVAGQLGLEPTLGEHIETMVDVFAEIWRVLKPTGTLWLNYGDSYAGTPNGRSAADTKATGNDDRTFRDKPFSTIGPIDRAKSRKQKKWGAETNNKGGAIFDKNYRKSTSKQRNRQHGTASQGGRIVAGGFLKPKDLCMIPNRLAIALQDAGWWVRAEIIWHKPNPMPESAKDRPTCAHEKVFLLTKSEKYFYDAAAVAEPVTGTTHARVSQKVAQQVGSARANGGSRPHRPMKAVTKKTKGRDEEMVKNNARFAESTVLVLPERNLRNVWTIPTVGFSEAHFATFPPDLAERCIKAGSPAGGNVLDPFGGAGTTALAAVALGRQATLIELSPEYAILARARIEAAYMGPVTAMQHMVTKLGKIAKDIGPLFAEAGDSGQINP